MFLALRGLPETPCPTPRSWGPREYSNMRRRGGSLMSGCKSGGEWANGSADGVLGQVGGTG